MRQLIMKKFLFSFSILILSLTLFSCNTTKEIPEGLSAAQLIQLGQNEYAVGNYKQAEQCYLEVIKKYGIDNAIYVEARYELGHLYLNSKKYKEAYNAYSEILSIYEDAFSGELPAAYKKLAQIGMDKIPENKKAEFAKSEPVSEE